MKPKTTPRLRALLWLATAAALSPVSAAAQRHFPSNDSLTALLKTRVGTTGVGMVLGVLEADGSTRIVTYGSGGLKAKPLGPKSVFEMGSVTKVFTGILLADLVESKKVALTDPVVKYLPAGVKMPTRNGKEITLLDLATHRSSLTRMPTNIKAAANERYPKYTIEEMYAYLNEHQLRRDIGSEYEYSNIAVALLGHVIERVNGRSYEQLMQEKILRPLGMTSSSTLMENVKEWLVVGHDENGLVAQYRGWHALPGMGALRSNAEDMLKFLAANTGPPQNRLERVMRLSHEVRASVDANADIGLNWRTNKYGQQRIVTHGGNTEGFSTYIAFDPDANRGVVVLANTAVTLVADIAQSLLNPRLTMSGVIAERVQVDVPESVLRAYVGDYELSPSSSVNVTLESGTLHFQPAGQPKFPMHPEGESKFFDRTSNLQISFTRDAAGKVAGMVVHQSGRDRPARRRSAPGVPLASAAEIAAALPGRKTTVPSAALGADRAVRVVAPAGYEMTQSLRYPVLYVLETERPLHMASTVAAGIANAGDGPQMLVVSVSGIPTAAERVNFGKFITDELQPWVAKEYRVEPLAVVVGDAPTVAAINAQAKIVAAPDLSARASFRGQQQPAVPASDAHDALRESLKWIFTGWKLDNMSKLAESPDSGWQIIDAHYAKLSERFGFKALPPEALADGAAGVLANQQRRYAEAVRLFEKNTKLHPGSAVTWNHLGDGLRFLCRRQEAQAAYAKAHELALAMSYANLSNYAMELSRVEQEINTGVACTAPGARASIAVSEAILRTYAGEYQLSPRVSITVTFEGGRLQAFPTGQTPRPIGAITETRFFVEGSTIELAFTKNAAGAVTGLIMYQGGQETPGTKIK